MTTVATEGALAATGAAGPSGPAALAGPSRLAALAGLSPESLRSMDGPALERLAEEIRAFLVSSVAATGGHLGSNLGAVELSLALHRVFDSPRDPIVWDTGHQAYVHKLVTGRAEGFAALRKAGGISGYPNRSESGHDLVENSHASTGLSYADGLARARDLLGGDHHVVAVVGDGALTGGLAYEALNNIGMSGRRVVIVLNDNGRSYAPTVSPLTTAARRSVGDGGGWATDSRSPSANGHGAVAGNGHGAVAGNGHGAVAGNGHGAVAANGHGAVAANGHGAVAGNGHAEADAGNPAAFFRALRIGYLGPVDGHDVAAVEQALHRAAEWSGPVAVHVHTQKGRGYPPAEGDPEKCLHDVSPFDPETGLPVVRKGSVPTYTEAFGTALVAEAAARPEVVAVTAAMTGPTGLIPFEKRFGDRLVDVGIAEQHAVTSAAGMAMGGLRPVVAIYSTFLNRAWDQVLHDVGLHRLPVVFCLDRAGVTGDDGPSHHGIMDLALLTKVPGMTVLVPSSYEEVGVMLHQALEISDGPVAIRWPKTPARHCAVTGTGLRGRKLRDGDGSVCLLGLGKLVESCERAAIDLERTGVQATVWDMRAAAPLDPAMLADASRHRVVVTAEDGVAEGGVGSAVAAALRGEGGTNSTTDRSRSDAPAVTVCGLPLAYLPHGKADDILRAWGLDGRGLAASARRALSG